MGGLAGHLGSFVVTCGCSYAALCVTIDWQAVNVDVPTSDAFVWFTFTSDSQCERVAHEFVGIEAADAVSVGDGCQIDEVNEGVALIEFYLQKTYL